MRASILCFLMLILVAKSQIDYTTQSVFSTGTCESIAGTAAQFKSPIIIENTLCGAYGTFNLNLPYPGALSPTFDVTSGAYKATYTQGSLTYNTTTYTSSAILLRYEAENILFNQGNEADAELQIIMSDTSGDLAVFSLFVRQSAPGGTADQGYTSAQTANPVITTLTASSWDIRLDTISNQITQRPKNEQQLNVFRYSGTLTYPPCTPAVWYLFGGTFFTDNLSSVIAGLAAQPATDVVLRSGQNSRTAGTSVANGGGGDTPLTIERLCFSGFFQNNMGENYGLWFGVIIILLFFIATLCVSDVPNKDPEYQESCKTIHPLYSVWYTSNEIHTRKSRASLVLMTLTIHALFTSTWYRRSYPEVKGSDIIVYAIYSMLISWAYVYILGNILRQYYVAKYHYCKTKEENWDQKAQNRIFAFYATIFATICIAWPFTVWNMGEIHPERSNKQSNYWVATFFVGLGLEFLLMDIICAVLSKSSHLLRNIIRRKGYFYDNLCHETFMNYLKMD